MELNSPDYTDLTGKVVLLKISGYTKDQSFGYRLRRVVDPCSPIDSLVKLARFNPLSPNSNIIELWNRNRVEGWLTIENAEKILVWEALQK